MTKALSLLTVLTLAAVGVTQLTDLIGPAGEEAALRSFEEVVDAAHLLTLFDEPWPQALATTVADLRRGADAITADGTTLTWRHDDACWTVDVPTADSPLTIAAC